LHCVDCQRVHLSSQISTLAGNVMGLSASVRC